MIFAQLDVRHLPIMLRQGVSRERRHRKIDIMGENSNFDSDDSAWCAATCDELVGYIMFGLEALQVRFLDHHHSIKQQYNPQRITSQLNHLYDNRNSIRFI